MNPMNVESKGRSIRANIAFSISFLLRSHHLLTKSVSTATSIYHLNMQVSSEKNKDDNCEGSARQNRENFIRRMGTDNPPQQLENLNYLLRGLRKIKSH